VYPNLKLQLWKTGMRQNRLAKMLQVDETRLSRIVNGYREPNAELRQSIARLLGCDAEWLFESIEPTSPSGPDLPFAENAPQEP
jgi:transcriptional regulator with XRE-family HTH domain